MAKITCRDYGFECHYEIEGEVENVIDEYRKHSTEEHGIEYSPEASSNMLTDLITKGLAKGSNNE